MEARNHDPDRLETPEVREKLGEVTRLILDYQLFAVDASNDEQDFAFGDKFSEIKSSIANAIGGEPVFRFEFLDSLGEVANYGSHSLDKDAKFFLAEEVEAQVMGMMRLSGQTEGSYMTMPPGTVFRVVLGDRRAAANSQ